MKAIQFTIDEALLRRVDADAEAKKDGRSALLRRAVTAYLDSKSKQRIREAYARGYQQDAPAQDELGPWSEVQAWPEE